MKYLMTIPVGEFHKREIYEDERGNHFVQLFEFCAGAGWYKLGPAECWADELIEEEFGVKLVSTSVPAVDKFLASSETATNGYERFEAVAELVATMGKHAEDAVLHLFGEEVGRDLLKACSLYKLHTRADFREVVRDALAKQLYSELSGN